MSRTVDERGYNAYERFLEMPVPVLLAGMWLGGVALLGSGVLTLYLLLATVIGA